MKTFKYLNLFALAAVFLAASPLQAESVGAPECNGKTTLISQQITVEPKKDCLIVNLYEAGCTGGTVIVDFNNQCETKVTIEGLEERDGFQIELQPTKTIADYVKFANDLEEQLLYKVTFGEAENDITEEELEVNEINILFVATSEEFSSPEEDRPFGCSTSGGNLSTLGALGFTFILVIGRRKDRRPGLNK